MVVGNDSFCHLASLPLVLLLTTASSADLTGYWGYNLTGVTTSGVPIDFSCSGPMRQTGTSLYGSVGCGAPGPGFPGGFTCSISGTLTGNDIQVSASCQTQCGGGTGLAAGASGDSNTTFIGTWSGSACGESGDGDITIRISSTNGSCGNGIRNANEECDDDPPPQPGDGCDELCFVELGWICKGDVGERSQCSPLSLCGDGDVDDGEECDDQNATNLDGCSACTIEDGYSCIGEPSTCTLTCSDGFIDPGEECDDNNLISGDCCSATCQIEACCACNTSPPLPSSCFPDPECGNGCIEESSGEECDDARNDSEDGCDMICLVEPGWVCYGEPSLCFPDHWCGDGTITPPDEECDDNNTLNGDCCDKDCKAELPHPCGEPSDAVCDNPDTCDGLGNCLSNYEPSATECRADAGECDVADFCDGAGSCLPDGFEPVATPCGNPLDTPCDSPDRCDGGGGCQSNFEPPTSACRPQAGSCDLTEFCDGAGLCLPDAVVPASTECRSAAGVCDLAELCDGISVTCPPDVKAPPTTECRPEAGQCDVAEVCDGVGDSCPANVSEPNGTICDDQNECSVGQVCLSGICQPGGPLNCDDGDSCTADGCDALAGCFHDPVPGCQAGVCGNGIVEVAEECDDSGVDNGDGCSGACLVEPGYVCSGSPSICEPASAVGFWPFDEATPPLARDFAGSVANDGTHINSPQIIGAGAGRALRFDGVDDFVTVPHNAEIDIATGDFSIAACVKDVATTGVRVIADKRTQSPGTVGYVFWLDSLRPSIQLADGQFTNFTTTTVLANDGQWHLVAATVDRSHLQGGRFYVDGQQAGTFNPTGRAGSLSNGADLWIGRRHLSTTGWFQGAIDELRIWKRALAAAEIQALGPCSASNPNGGLVAHWDITSSTGFEDVVGTFDPTEIVEVTLAPDRFGSGMSAAHFGGDISEGGPAEYGATSYLLVPQHPGLSPPSLTTAFWFKFEAGSIHAIPLDNQHVPASGIDERGYGWSLLPLGNPQRVSWSVGRDHAEASGLSIDDGTWHHLAGSYDMSTQALTVYFDGRVVEQGLASPYRATEAIDFTIGAANHGLSTLGHNFVGWMDDIRLYSRALSQQEVIELVRACDNAIDDDGDGLIDFGAGGDPGCDDSDDLSERRLQSEGPPFLPCDDDANNDADAFSDYPDDPGCAGASGSKENPQCQDGINNDGQYGIDFDGGASAGNPTGIADPQCTTSWKDKEKKPGCGLGFELSLLLPALMKLRRRVEGAAQLNGGPSSSVACIA